MYETYYGLSTNPFRLVPDARFFFASSGHRHALAYLRYGLLQSEGFVVVTGNPGTGKSMLVQTLFSEMKKRSMMVANLSSTNLGENDILRAVGHCFSVYEAEKNKASLLLAIETYLRKQSRLNKTVVLIIDEAQNLPLKSLEELRMLTNFQDGNHALLQIILLGQLGLAYMLADPRMEQLSQRVIATCRLEPLDAVETRAYIGHRLQCAGWHGDPTFTGEALSIIYGATSGVPRMLNIFCDRLLLAGSLEEKHEIDALFAREVLGELRLEHSGAINHHYMEGQGLVDMPPLPDEQFVFPAPAVDRAVSPVYTVQTNTEDAEMSETAGDESRLPVDEFEPGFSETEAESQDNVPAAEQVHETPERPVQSDLQLKALSAEEQPTPGLWQRLSWRHPRAVLLMEVVVVLVVMAFIFTDVPMRHDNKAFSPMQETGGKEQQTPAAPATQEQQRKQINATMNSSPSTVAVALAPGQEKGIPEIELLDLVYNLIFYYSSGDLDGLTALFAANAKTDDAQGKAEIRKSYAMLFKTTDMRKMQIDKLQWQQQGDTAAGSGSFKINAWDKNGEKRLNESGVLTIDAIKVNGELKISKLSLASAN
jgi:general secretion pathway protein A